MRISLRSTPALWLALALVAACAAASPAEHQQSAQVAIAPATRTSVTDTTPNAQRAYTAADIQFMGGMIGHHAQAIVMAHWAPTHEASPAIRRLADRIINAQQDEIAAMQRWLRDRNQPVPEARPTGMRMMMNGVEHDMLMPGMLTEAQMKQLDQARGPEFDRLFLTFMIQHHRGAVSMVKELFDSYGAGQDETVFKFASDVNVDQSTEIARMEKMLVYVTLGIGTQ